MPAWSSRAGSCCSRSPRKIRSDPGTRSSNCLIARPRNPSTGSTQCATFRRGRGQFPIRHWFVFRPPLLSMRRLNSGGAEDDELKSAQRAGADSGSGLSKSRGRSPHKEVFGRSRRAANRPWPHAAHGTTGTAVQRKAWLRSPAGCREPIVSLPAQGLPARTEAGRGCPARARRW